MNIPYPNPEERREAINRIVEKGLSARRISGFPAMARSLSPRILFFGVKDCVVAAAVAAVLAYAAVIASAASGQNFAGLVLFLLSPVFYILLYCLATGKELQENTWEIPMSCHYTLRHLTTMRMLYFGGFGAVADTLLAFFTSQSSGWPFLRMLGLSLSSLFLYASLSVFFLLRARRASLQLLAPPAVWIAAGFGLGFLLPDFGAGFFSAVPEWVTLLFAVCFCVVFLAQLHGYLGKNKEENSYAVG